MTTLIPNRPEIREFVYDTIDIERDHQLTKYGADKLQSLAGYLLILRRELEEAEEGWMKGIDVGRNSPLAEIVQIAAVAVACLERYGTEGNTRVNVDDDTVIGIKSE